MSGSLDRLSIIDDAYRTFLQRPPDEPGLQYHLETLAQASDDEFVKTFYQRILHAPEFQLTAIAAATRAPALLSQDVEVLGLGTHCFAAELLEDMGLRRFSLPFDWIFSTPEMILHALADDFRIFLDASNYEWVPPAERPVAELYRVQHRFYLDEFGVDYVFNHHDPVSNPSDYEYFTRTVARFRELYDRPLARAFVTLNQDRKPSEGHLEAYAKLGRALPSSYCVFVNVEHTSGLVPTYEILDQSERHEVARFGTTSLLQGVVFPALLDRLVLTNVLSDRVTRGLGLAQEGTT